MDQTLLMLAKDVRGKTLKLIGDVSSEDGRFTAPGLQNSILWHAGHALVVVEHLAVSAISGNPPCYPKGWFDKFSWKSDPATVKDWPKIEEVRLKLSEQIVKLTDLIERLTEKQLSQVVDAQKGRTLRYSILHGFHDEANHQGEIWTLKKMLARQRTPGA